MLSPRSGFASAAIAALTLFAGSSLASVTWSGSSGTRAATAVFDVSGSHLTILLSNDSTLDAMQPTDILTGVYFNIAGESISFSRLSVVVASGSSVLNGTTDPGNVVGGEFAYRGGLSGAPGNARYGVSSSGLGLFGPSNLFPGSNLSGPSSPDGIQYGLTTAGDNPATGNGGINSDPLIKNAVLITLGNAGECFDLNDISNVQFQYGTALNEPHFPGTPTPAPGSAVLLGAGIALLGGSRRRS